MKTKSRIYNQDNLISLGISLDKIKIDLIKACLSEINNLDSYFNCSFLFSYGTDSSGINYIECECIKF